MLCVKKNVKCLELLVAYIFQAPLNHTSNAITGHSLDSNAIVRIIVIVQG